MTFEQELLAILNQIPAAIEKALTEAMVLRHPGHGNQKTHGNRFGVGQAKESFRRLKDDKAARERYKATARKKRGQGNDSKPLTKEQRVAKGKAIAEKSLKKTAGKSAGQLQKEYGVKKGDFQAMVLDDNTGQYSLKPVSGYVLGDLALPAKTSKDVYQITHTPSGMSTGFNAPKNVTEGLQRLIALNEIGNWKFGGNNPISLQEGMTAISQEARGAREVLGD